MSDLLLLQPSAPAHRRGEDAEVLNLVVHPDSDVGMVQIGHLQSWYGKKVKAAQVQVPTMTPGTVASGVLSSLFMFHNLSSLKLSFDGPAFQISQKVVCSIAELSGLQICQVVGGCVSLEGPSLEVLSNLRRLEDLSIRPRPDNGLGDVHVQGLASLPSTLKSLSIRGSTDYLTDLGLSHLTHLSQLTKLEVTPLGVSVTKPSISHLLSALPSVQNFEVGLHHVGQVAAVRDPSSITRSLKNFSLVVDDPLATPLEWSALLTSCTLCMCSSLVSLRLGLVKMQDATFMMALGSLTCLTELKFAVAPAFVSTPSFTLDLTALTSLSRLASLDIAGTKRLKQPLTPRTLTLCALSWPLLQELSLTIMARPEVVSETLALMDLFTNLKALSLYCPLDFEEVDRSTLTQKGPERAIPTSSDLTQINLAYLPASLEKLHLEHAELQIRKTSSAGGAAHAAGHALFSIALDEGHAQGKVGPSEHGSTRATSPSLLTLELDACEVKDNILAVMMEASPQLKCLELNSVTGISNQGLVSALASLRGLSHLVVSDIATQAAEQEPVPRQSSLYEMLFSRSLSESRSGGGQERVQYSLQQLAAALSASTSSLTHLEWAPGPEPLSEEEMMLMGPAAFRNMSALRFLYIDVETDAVSSVEEDKQEEEEVQLRVLERNGSSSVHYRALNPQMPDSEALKDPSSRAQPLGSWRKQLRKVLPMCTITTRASSCMSRFDIFDDVLIDESGTYKWA
ncbi:hypothetical protein CEUSTIGMA_g6810.t1 [Chlamydomonas eustigma]|uniref:Uncharacterized protein n=1 Tax=Chlamydomonas eustigma TaxID=1157962 RepID=A0A250X8G2_9CHLO|nr:hypothetical protein CEUSTIGMA_g6810.t1 [Chlamydomonas eustigma]|eukprot:GAX79368.1 hypothetical protein CEUSTIGMA_g6810.t1 [Chlamydomonas eustigma]